MKLEFNKIYTLLVIITLTTIPTNSLSSKRIQKVPTSLKVKIESTDSPTRKQANNLIYI